LNNKLSDKDKRDWQNFISSEDKIENKDNFNSKSNNKQFLKTIDLI